MHLWLLLLLLTRAPTPSAGNADTCLQVSEHAPLANRCSGRTMASADGAGASARDSIVLGGGCFW
jgi:hypothetical protein